jgi:DNA ligase-1
MKKVYERKNTNFKKLAELFNELENVSSSLKMIDILASFLKEISPEEARITAYLIKGKIAADYKSIEMGLAEKLVIRALAKATKKTNEEIQKHFHKVGDLGDIAFELIKKESSNLTIVNVFDILNNIAKSSGKGSQEQKLNLLANLLESSSSVEAKYITRIVLGTLRLGVAEMTFLYGISKTLVGSKEAKKTLEHAYNVFSDLGEVAYQALKYGIKNLEKAEPIVGVPIRMMLAQRIAEISEIKEHIPNKVFIEYKYDGERIQAHIKNDEIVLYSRKHENITYQFPDIIENLKKAFSDKNAILEGEAVAVNKKTGELEKFQILMKRRRKYEVEKYTKETPVKYFIFDILYLNNKSLLNENLLVRKEKLEQNIKENDEIALAKYIISENQNEIEDFFEESLAQGAEGVMIKDSLSIYQAGIRGWNWIKFKKDYKKELVDTFDLVVVGALYGAGKRAGTYGSLLLASFDPKTNKYYTFTKVGAGFTDKDLEELPKILNKYKIKEKHRLVSTEMKADIWFEPVKILEVEGAEITISPVHTVASDIIKKGGLALRFPRFLRWRDDKSAEEATTVEEIYEIYKKSK